MISYDCIDSNISVKVMLTFLRLPADVNHVLYFYVDEVNVVPFLFTQLDYHISFFLLVNLISVQWGGDLNSVLPANSKN